MISWVLVFVAGLWIGASLMAALSVSIIAETTRTFTSWGRISLISILPTTALLALAWYLH